MCGTVALLCAAVLLSSAVVGCASGVESTALVRTAVFEALCQLGIELPEPIAIPTVEKSDRADLSVLENSCVIGHSHAVGMQMTLEVPGLDYIAEVGLMAGGMLSHNDFKLPTGELGTLRMGLERENYDRIYVLLGSNDILGGSDHLPGFTHEMEKLLDVLVEYQPDARICLLSVAPLSESFTRYCLYNSAMSETSIKDYNYALRALAVSRGIEYLDITTPLSDERGYLSADFDRGDGLHFNEAGNEVILETILTHTGE